MLDYFNSKQKKWIAGISGLLLAATQITTPIDVNEFLPAQLTSPFVINVLAIVTLVGALWVLFSETD